MSRVYVINDSRAVSTAITILQIKAGAATSLEIVRAWVTQESSTVSAQTAIQLNRKSAAATVTSLTPLIVEPNTGAAAAVGGTAATGRTATAEGTDTDVIVREGFNVLNGWLYLPVPEERIVVTGGGILGLKFPIAPTNITYDYGIIFREIG